MNKKLHNDAKLIELAGGAPVLARRLMESNSAVCNWRWRGIPTAILLKHYAYFDKLRKSAYKLKFAINRKGK